MSQDALHGARIILVEDDTFLANVIMQKLEAVGAQVLHYPNGEEGLKALRANMPDVLLLDIMMPVMNGYEVLEAMKEEGLIEKIPTIIISNSGEPVEIQRVVDFGVKDYLVKADFTPEEVLAKARLILNAENGEAAAPDTAPPPAAPQPVQEETKTETEEKTGVAPEPKAEDTQGVKEETPKPPKEEKSAPAAPAANAGDSGGLKVLVVEDDQLLRNLLAVKLTKNHFSPMYVEDGSKAHELASSFKPDVVLLDLMLPGIDGFGILEQLKADDELKDIPVMVFSNKGDGADKDRAMGLGAAAYNVKAHTDLNEVIEELHTLTGK